MILIMMEEVRSLPDYHNVILIMMEELWFGDNVDDNHQDDEEGHDSAKSSNDKQIVTLVTGKAVHLMIELYCIGWLADDMVEEYCWFDFEWNYAQFSVKISLWSNSHEAG